MTATIKLLFISSLSVVIAPWNERNLVHSATAHYSNPPVKRKPPWRLPLNMLLQSAAEAAGFDSDFESLLPELGFESVEPLSPLFSPPLSEPPLPPLRLVP